MEPALKKPFGLLQESREKLNGEHLYGRVLYGLVCVCDDLPPGGVGNDGVDDTNQKGRVEKIGLHWSTFSNGSSNNGGKSASKGKLEEPILKTNVVALEEKALVSDKGLVGAIPIVTTISQGISNRPKGEATTTGVEKIPQDDVLDVLGANGTGAEHGETSLHKVDQCTGKDQVESINTIGKTRSGCIVLLFTQDKTKMK